jgi:hypothetical protein
MQCLNEQSCLHLHEHVIMMRSRATASRVTRLWVVTGHCQARSDADLVLYEADECDSYFIRRFYPSN